MPRCLTAVIPTPSSPDSLEPLRIQRARQALRPGRTTARCRAHCQEIVRRWEADQAAPIDYSPPQARIAYNLAWPEGLRLHLALLTWRRPAYLRKTLASFFEHNDEARFSLWCGTDGGFDPEVLRIAAQARFQVVSVPSEHLGIARAWSALIEAVAQQAGPGDLVLNLEEDWASLRPLPMGLAYALLSEHGVFSVRLWQRKLYSRAVEEWGVYQACAARSRTAVYIGRAWVAHPPCIASVAFARWVNANVRDEEYMIRRCLATGVRIAWIPRSPFRHIGNTRSRDIGGRT